MSNGSGCTLEKPRSKRACLTCKKRKKKCSGTLPCDYCCKIGNIQGCEYKTRLPKKTVRVSERYVASLKSKICYLESQLSKLTEVGSNYSEDSGSYVTEQNPLIENSVDPEQDSTKRSREDDEITLDDFSLRSNGDEGKIRSRRYFGDSSCSSFLVRIKQALDRPAKIDTFEQVISPKRAIYEEKLDWDCIKKIKSDIPPLSSARDLVSSATRIIGSDYLFIEQAYIDDFIQSNFYEDVDNVAMNFQILQYSEELALFYAYLALGHLFDSSCTSKTDSGSPQGFQYFEKAVHILGLIFKYYDECSGPSLIQAFLYVAYYALSVDKGALAYVMVGNAIRVAFTLGIHKKSLDPLHNRIFWLCFLYDRLISIRFGFPLMINENDVEIPLWHCFDKGFFSVSLERYHFEAQVNLAKITTHIVQKIYTKNKTSFIQNCYAILKELKDWLDQLPSPLKFDYNDFQPATSRSTVNLHINYNYLIILTTRSVVFYVFNKVVQSGKNTDELFPEDLRKVITILLESSVQAAQIQSSILTKLHYDGKMVNKSFLDCHYIFNSSIVLILAAFLQSLPNFLINDICDMSALFKRVQDNLDVLQRISQFNITAYNFNKQLTELIELISSDKVQKRYQGGLPNPLIAASNVFGPNSNSSEQVKDGGKAFPDLEFLGHLDLSQVLEFMISNDHVTQPSIPNFDNEDFLKYSNFPF